MKFQFHFFNYFHLMSAGGGAIVMHRTQGNKIGSEVSPVILLGLNLTDDAIALGIGQEIAEVLLNFGEYDDDSEFVPATLDTADKPGKFCSEFDANC